MKMNLYGQYPCAYVQAEKQHGRIAYFAPSHSQEGHGNDIKNGSFII
jgi:hypothetical protein